MMPKKKSIILYRNYKIFQLVCLVLFELIFIITLIVKPDTFGKRIFSDSDLFFVCSITWSLMIANLLFILFDFHRLKHIVIDSKSMDKQVYLDDLTGIPNRNGLDTIFQSQSSPKALGSIGCCLYSIENLKEINESMGYATGDLTIQNFSSILEEVGDQFGYAGRNGGNEYLVIIQDCSHEKMKKFIDLMASEISDYNEEHSLAPIITKCAYSLNNELHKESFNQIITATYNKLHF